MKNRTAVLAGPTGLVGSKLLRLLLDAPEYRKVVALSRRPIPIESGRLDVRPAEFDSLPTILSDIRGSESTPLDVFCCLGTTMRVAGSPEVFRRVDLDYPLCLGRWALDASARRMLVISALGADPRSRVFYNRVKGEMEQALGALGLPSLVVLRPSLLAGKRSEVRRAERVALRLATRVGWLLPRSVRPIGDVDVAAAMLSAAREDRAPLLIESAQMQGAAARLRV
jgi:uncharacterized protein YbjT (DUF2867 family)